MKLLHPGAIDDLLFSKAYKQAANDNLTPLPGWLTSTNLAKLDKSLCRKLFVIGELFRQQQWMYQQHQRCIERFKQRFDHYPASVHVDQLYRPRTNWKYC
ncbi:MAG TPA: hypothetical protein V6C78_16895 [Crinalium sp.]